MLFILRFVVFFFSLVVLGVTSCSTGSNTGSSSSNANVVEFLTPLTISKDGIFVGEETQIQVTLSLKRDTSILITEVVLIRVDGDQETELEVMTDDGNPDTGDLIANDSIYNLLFSLNETATSFISVKAKIEFEYQGTNTTNYSETKTIAVMNRLSDEQWNTILNTPDLAQTYYDTLSGTSEQNASEVASYLLTLSGVANSGTSEEGHGIWWVYETGVLGGIIFDAHVGGSTHKGGPENNSPSPLWGQPPLKLRGGVRGSYDGDDNAIQSKKALYLGPYLWDFGESDDYHGAWEKITGATCPSFVADEYSNSSEGDQFVTLDHFKNLSDYGIVVISTHGDNWYNGLFTWWDDYFGGDDADPSLFNWLADELSVVILSSGFLLTDENKEDYESDIQQHRLVVASDQELLLTPSFIDAYNSDFPNSIIYISSCRSTYNDSLAQVFLDHGAGSVLGYSDYVSATYARDIGGETFSDVDGLLDLSLTPTSVLTAHTQAVLVHGESDGDDDPAFYDLRGSEDTNLDMAPILDGFFEEARISSWISFGEYMAQGYVGDIESPEGDFMGVMTTYLGNTENIEVGGSTFLSQSFCVPDGATTLNFQYNVISEEAECGVDDRFVEDTFKVFVFDDDGNYLGGNPLVSESSSTSEWFALEGDYFYAGDDASTPGECHPEDNSRDDGTFETGWKSISLDISSYAGTEEPLTLYFEVNDGGDLIYDTVVGIDEVFVE